MSTRITKEIREAIAKDLVKHRFTDAVQAIYKKRADLADAVYRDLYKASEREQMAALPAGMLPEVDELSVRFGGSYTNVYFSGFMYGDLSKVASAARNGTNRRVFFKHKGTCAKDYDARHKLAIQHEEINGAAADLVKEVYAAHRAAIGAISKVGTIKRLIEVWPEVAPFARRFDTGPAQLPAIRTEHLNKILDLPVPEAA